MMKDAATIARADSLPESHATEHIGLVLADSYPILLDGLDRLFRSEPGFTVLACCSTGEETIRAVRRHRPHVLVLDLGLADRGALDVLRQIRTEAAPRVVLHGERFDENVILEATHLGVRGLILKSMPAHLLVRCVRKVHRGGEWIEKASMTRVVEHLALRRWRQDETVDRLTPRELEVLRLVARGESNKAIANALCVGEGTVKAHIHHVYEKLGVRGRLELVLAARDKGLLSSLVADRPMASALPK